MVCRARFLTAWKKIVLGVMVFGGAFFVAAIPSAEAATLYLSPSSGNYQVGDTFSTRVLVSTEGVTMNAVSGVISFPTHLLEATSVESAGGLISLWVEEPQIDSSGSVSFEGIVLNPGFNGSNGEILTINFKVKDTGTIPVDFISGTVLANNGLGTNILETFSNASYSVGATVEPVAVEVRTGGVPGAPVITSSTHPDQDKWYPDSTAAFSWLVSPDITGARLLFNESPNSTPTVRYDTPISEKVIEDIEDGSYFFHARLQNDNGLGRSGHFGFNIDTVEPEFLTITQIENDDPSEPRVQFELASQDVTSGIASYEIKLDDEDAVVIEGGEEEIYTTPILSGGNHILVVKVSDKAGNSRGEVLNFFVDSLAAPVITEYPPVLAEDEVMTITGTTMYPDTDLELFVIQDTGLVPAEYVTSQDARTYTTMTREDGSFTFTNFEAFDTGTYVVYAEVVDERGARSLPSNVVEVAVEAPLWAMIQGYLLNIVTFIIILVILLGILLYRWKFFYIYKRRAQKEIDELVSSTRREFALLRDDIEDHLVMLEETKRKSKLRDEEIRIFKELKGHVRRSEKKLLDEAADVEHVISRGKER